MAIKGTAWTCHGQVGWLEALVSAMKAHAGEEDVQWLGSWKPEILNQLRMYKQNTYYDVFHGMYVCTYIYI